MTATEFEFDGIKSSVYGLYICSFDGSKNGVFPLGSEITVNTVKAPRGTRLIKTGSAYEAPLSFTFQVVKLNSYSESEEISPRELARIMRWLVRSDNYHYLRFEQSEWENIFYNCFLKVQKYEIAGQIVGLEIEATCDAPWGYSERKEHHLDFALKNEYHIHNYSDEDGGILPDLVTIQCRNDGMLAIKNTFSIRKDETNQKTITVKIANCKKDETIQLDRHRNICSSMPHEGLMSDFNHVFLELFSNLYNSENTLYSDSGCILSVFYREIRKGVPA